MLASSDKAFFNVLYRGLMHCGRVSDHVTSPYSNVVTSMLGVPVYDKIQQTAVIEQRDSMKGDAGLTSHLRNGQVVLFKRGNKQ